MSALKPIVIAAGTGYCGTKYLAKALTAVGVVSGHEDTYRPPGAMRGANDAPHDAVAEVSWLATPFMRNINPDEVLRVHVVRHPLKVVQSMMSLPPQQDDSWGWYYTRFYDWFDDPCINAIVRVLKMNRELERWVSLRVRVEDKAHAVLQILNAMQDRGSIGHFDPLAVMKAVDEVPSDTNKKNHDGLVLEWSDLPRHALTDRLKAMTRRYGYA